VHKTTGALVTGLNVAGYLDVFVPGVPQPKGSLHMVRCGRGALARIVPSYKTRLGEAWERAIMAHCKHAQRCDGAVCVTLRFVMPRPKSVRRALPSVRPDLDKLTRAVLDALQRAGVYRDDGQVVCLLADKSYPCSTARAGVRINIRPLEAIRRETL